MKKALALYTDSYQGLSAQTWWLSLVMLINRSGTMVVPFLTIYLTQKLHYSITQAGWIMGIYGLGSITGALLGGRLTDRIGFYRVQLMALGSGGIMFIVLGHMTSLRSICICTLLLSIVNEAFRPANSTAIAAYSSPAAVTRSFSLNRLAINLGWAAGGAMGGLVASYNYSLLFWIDGCTNISAGILLLFFIPPGTARAFLPEKTTPANNRSTTSAFADKTYLYFLFLTTLFAFCFFQLFTLQPVFFKQELGLSISFIGALMAINGVLLASIEMMLVYRLEGKRKNTWYIAIGVLLVGISYVILNFRIIPAVWMALCSILLITFGEILAMPFMNSFWISRTKVHNRGQYASLYTIAYSVAQILAPALGSQVVERAGFTALWWLIGLISCINALLFSYMKSKPVPGEIPLPAK